MMQRNTYYVDCLVLNPRAWWYVKHISHPLLIIICRLNNIYKEDITIENVGTGKKMPVGIYGVFDWYVYDIRWMISSPCLNTLSGVSQLL